MAVENIPENNFFDIFSNNKEEQTKGPVRFGSEQDINNVDILETPKNDEPPKEDVEPPKDGDAPPDENQADLLGTSSEKKVGRPLKDNFSDLSGYFEDRLKKGKFVAIDTEDEEGKIVKFVPKTPEEFDEVIDIQVNYQLDQKKKELEEKWYQSKSPAWQAVAQYAEMTNDPSEILPFIQGVKNIDSVKDLDPLDIPQAEDIVRARLSQRGDSKDLIEEQIDALKTTDKLVSTAQKYKPLILQEEQNNLARMVHQQKEEQARYHQMITGYRDEAIKAIESPIFGKQKLKKDEQAIIYDMIAIPSEETKGYRIYSEIDNLYEKSNFELLKKIALLIAKEESLLGYVSTSTADKTAENLQKKLRISTDNRNSGSSGNEDTGGKPAVQRNQYNTVPKFGR